jgi:hypothetical protein
MDAKSAGVLVVPHVACRAGFLQTLSGASTILAIGGVQISQIELQN